LFSGHRDGDTNIAAVSYRKGLVAATDFLALELAEWQIADVKMAGMKHAGAVINLAPCPSALGFLHIRGKI
jgi:DNA primase